jgi:Type II secretion system (T2SS), protein E, N-terminal domain
MSIKMGEMLVEAGLLTPAQLKDALRNQVNFGGSLGTNLVDLGYLEDEELAQFSSRQLGLPCATTEELMSVPLEVIRLVPKELAEKYMIIPLSREKKRLTLAMLDPSDLSVIDEISFVTGYFIIPVIAPELRLLQALENHYNIKRNARFIQITDRSRERQRLRKQDEADEQALIEAELIDLSLQQEMEEFIEVMEEAGPSAEPERIEPITFEPVVVEPEIEATVEAEPVIEEPAWVEPPIAEPVEVESEIAAAFEAETVTAEPPIAQTVWVEPAGVEPVWAEHAWVTIESLSEALAESKDREKIADMLVAYLGQEFNRVVLFMVKGTVICGWRALRGNKEIPGIENLQISLDVPSVLKVVADGKSFYLGAIPDTPDNAGLLAGIGGDAPDSVLLIPMMLMGRVIAIVYLDGGKEPVANRLADLQKIVGKAAIAFEILILKNKILMA